MNVLNQHLLQRASCIFGLWFVCALIVPVHAGLSDLHPSLHPAPRSDIAYQDRELKFNPGNYVLISDKTYTPITSLGTGYLNAVLEPGILGMQKRYYWKDIEPTKDNFDFSTIDADVAWCNANNRKLVPMIGDKIFFGEFIPVPDYVATGSEYGSATTITGYGGTYYGVYDEQGDGQHIIARRWNKPVEERFINLMRILGERYDSEPMVEAIYLIETAPGYMNPTDPDYSDEKYYNHLLWRLKKTREYWPQSQLFQSANGFPSLWSGTSKKYQGFEFFLALGETLREMNGIMSGPDILPLYVYDGTPPYNISDYENFLRTLYRPQDNQLLMGCSAQYDSYWWHTDGTKGSSLTNLVPMQDIFNAGFEEMNVDYLFYVYRPDDAVTPNAYSGTPAGTTVVDDVFGSATVQAKFPRTYNLSDLDFPAPYLDLRLNETVGSTASDAGTGGNNGNWGAVARTTGRDHGAALFSGSDDAITLPDITYAADVSPLADNTSADSTKGSVAFWFKISASQLSTGEAVQYLYHHDDGTNDALNIYIDRAADQLVTDIQRGSGNQDEVMTVESFATNYADDAWHLYTLNFNYKVLTVYVDGRPQDMETHEPYGAYSSTTDRSYTTLNPASGITLGDNPLAAGNDFNGAIDEVRIYEDFATITHIHAMRERPGHFVAVPGDSGVIDLFWSDESDDEDAFQIQRSDSGSGPYSDLTTVTTNVVDYVDGGLVPEQIYYYRLRKIGGGQKDSEWTYASASAGAAAVPSAPDMGYVDSIATDAMTWHWYDNSNDEYGFYIYGASGLTPPSTSNETLPVNTIQWTASGLSTNTAFAFQVSAYNASGESSKTSAQTAWTLAARPPAPIIDGTGTTTATLSVDNADSNPPTTDYRAQVDGSLWVQSDGTLGATPTIFTQSDTIALSGLSPDTTYQVALLALNGDAVLTSASAATVLLTLPTLPAAPSGFSAIKVSTNSITLQWTDNATNEDRYNVYFAAGSSPGATPAQTPGPDTESSPFGSLSPNALYTAKVAAQNRAGESIESETLSLYTLALRAKKPILRGLTSTSGSFEIDATDGNPVNTLYRLRLTGPLGEQWVQNDSTLGATPAEFAAGDTVNILYMQAQTSYDVSVIAVNGDGVFSDAGPSLAVTTTDGTPSDVAPAIWMLY